MHALFYGLLLAAQLLFSAQFATGQYGPFIESCRNDTYPPADANEKVEWRVVNLDLPPAQRWNEIAREKRVGMRAMFEMIKGEIPFFLRGYIIGLVDKKLPAILKNLPKEYSDEIRGLAKASKMQLGELVLFNLFYEFDAMCTSIVSRGPDGRLYHARDLDFGLFLGWDFANSSWKLTDKLRPLVLNVDFQKGGNSVFKSTTFAGYVGMITGLRPQSFSLTINERYALKGGWWGLISFLRGDHSGSFVGFLGRQVLQYSTSFAAAKSQLERTKILAPVYFILGGRDSRTEACVITRSFTKVEEERCVNDDTWYVLETNYDWWKKPLFVDNRRYYAAKCMNETTSNGADLAGLFNVLNTRPVINKLTVYTSLMQVDDGSVEAWIRTCKGKCWPW